MPPTPTTITSCSVCCACLRQYHSLFLAVASLILTGVMGMRFMNSGKFMPAGLVAALRFVV
ncbi:MAG: hypothetical protein CUN55_20635 [Phototrophicales bacterium]|nr:MAG: hypothetical protein CUN55_20635 [Phototrophicales bacterium]